MIQKRARIFSRPLFDSKDLASSVAVKHPRRIHDSPGQVAMLKMTKVTVPTRPLAYPGHRGVESINVT